MNLRIFLWSLTAALAGFIFGFDTVVISGVEKTIPSLWGLSPGLRGIPQQPEYYRPAFHFSPEKNWTNDPNGLVFFHSKYHLFYQYNPFGDVWGHMSWGHSISADLVKWRQLPVALSEENGIMIFSGSAVVDWKNTSGFGKHGVPPLVAVYTGYRPGLQNQNVAYSTDSGLKWTKYSGNPVLDIHEAEFRDPMVFWYAPASHWVMVVSMAKEHRIRFYSSPNLKTWNLSGEFGPAGATDVPNWECPNLFPIKDPKGQLKWILLVGVGSGGPAKGSATQYFIGDFDGRKFVNDNPSNRTLWVDFGPDFYAAQTWSDISKDDGRRIMLAWMNNWDYADKVPTHPWRGQMTFPRMLGFADTRDGLRLTQNPVREMEPLRQDHVGLRNARWSDLEALLARQKWPATLEIVAKLQLRGTREVAFELRKGAGHETRVGFDVKRLAFYVDRTRSSSALSGTEFASRHEAPSLGDGDVITLHILLDRSSVELFGDNGLVAITDLIFPDRSDTGAGTYVDGEPPQIISLDMWTLQSKPLVTTMSQRIIKAEKLR
jgi:fructan beta-fructosidase